MKQALGRTREKAENVETKALLCIYLFHLKSKQVLPAF